MQEYSRKATIAESRLEEIHKRSVYHDDHLRVIDAWLAQVSVHILECDQYECLTYVLGTRRNGAPC